MRREDAPDGDAVRLTQEAAQLPLAPELEAIAKRLTNTRGGCAIGGNCTMCHAELVGARADVIGVWNTAHDAAEAAPNWTTTVRCAVCGETAREGNHATDFGVGHDFEPQIGP